MGGRGQTAEQGCRHPSPQRIAKERLWRPVISVAQGSRSTRTVSRSVPMSLTNAALIGPSVRCRARASSPSSTCARPLRQRPPTRSRTRGLALMFLTKPASCPCSATIQNVLPSSPLPTGLRHGLPLFLPVVSKRDHHGMKPAKDFTTGLTAYFPSALETWRLFILGYSSTQSNGAQCNTKNHLRK